MMQCPECGSTTVSKNGQRKGKQNYLCQVCQRQFIDTYEPKSYTPPGQRHLNLVDRWLTKSLIYVLNAQIRFIALSILLTY